MFQLISFAVRILDLGLKYGDLFGTNNLILSSLTFYLAWPFGYAAGVLYMAGMYGDFLRI